MTPVSFVLVLHGFLLLGPDHEDRAEPGHRENVIDRAVRSEGLKVGEARVTLPAPALNDGLPADAERAALVRIAGSDRAAAELTRDSVSAPIILRTRDETAGTLGKIRVADLWFVVHARLDDIDPDRMAGGAKENQTVEAANMRFTAARLRERPKAPETARAWYVHLSGRLLDRIEVEATDRIEATKTDGSWLIASRTDPAFDDDPTAPNRWLPITRKGAGEERGKAEPYPGGISYVKVSRLGTVPGALLVEAHFAFFEPRPWFDGAPILRSKIGVVAQDRVRALRRELAESRKTSGSRRVPGPLGG